MLKTIIQNIYEKLYVLEFLPGNHNCNERGTLKKYLISYYETPSSNPSNSTLNDIKNKDKVL